MTITFNDIPTAWRVPSVLTEVDSSNSQQGPSLQTYTHLVIGNRLAAGTVAKEVPTLVTSADQARKFFGAGSMLHNMAQALFRVDRFTKTIFIAQDEPVGAKATGTVTIVGTATAAGTLYLLIGGRRVDVGVAVGDTATTIAAAIVTAANKVDDLPVTSGSAAGVYTATARHNGTVGNGLHMTVNYFDGQELPAGITATIVDIGSVAAGTGDNDVSELWPFLGEDWYNQVSCGYNDAANVTAFDTEFLDRYGPTRAIDGYVHLALNDTHANLITYGDGKNSQFVHVQGVKDAPHPTWEWAAAQGAMASRYLQADPARPLQRRVLKGLLPPKPVDRFTAAERNLLLFDGIATHTVDAGGRVLMERLISTYQQSGGGAPDTAFLDIQTSATLSYLRYDFRNRMLLKFPNHKLANDGTRFGAGQKVVTPSVGRAEALAAFRQWEELGLVEGFEQFKTDLVVQRNLTDPNRLDFRLPVDVMNQLRVIAGQVQFLL